jgi:apolipoprotein N-acyltransferase
MAYASAAAYYGAALWPLIPAANNFYGSDVSVLSALFLWGGAATLLALPWPMVWSADTQQALWRAPLGVVLSIVPPLGIVGWASPVLAAGVLFPTTGWCGLFGCGTLTGALAVWPRAAAAVTIVLAGLANLVHPTDPRPPAGWTAVDTHFGSIAHRTHDPLSEYRVAQEIQREALSRQASVIVFPETVVPYWTASTDAFWKQTLVALRTSGKTVLVGARVPIARESAGDHQFDFSSSLAVLRGEPASLRPRQESSGHPQYLNAIVVRGVQNATIPQRIPVPIAMWNSLQRESAQLNLLGSGIVRIGSERAAIIICYEQLVVWPVVTSMIRHPSVIVAPMNAYWTHSTTIPIFQRTAMRSWARLFGIPYLLAVNT